MAQTAGDDFYAGHGGAEFELTPKGRVAVRVGGVTYFRSEGDRELTAARVRGGRAEFAQVEPDGRMVWTFVPLAPVSQN